MIQLKKRLNALFPPTPLFMIMLEDILVLIAVSVTNILGSILLASCLLQSHSWVLFLVIKDWIQVCLIKYICIGIRLLNSLENLDTTECLGGVVSTIKDFRNSRNGYPLWLQG